MRVLGRIVARRAGPVVVIWAVLGVLGYAAAVGGLFGDSLFDRLVSGDLEFPSESATGRELLAENSPTGATYQLLLSDVDVEAASLAAALQTAATDLIEIDGVVLVADPSTAGPAFVSTDGDAVLVTVGLDPALSDTEQADVAEQVVTVLDEVPAAIPGATGTVTGVSLIVEEVTEQVETDLRTGELVALPVSLLIMVVIFGGFAAASVPIAGALASIAGGLGSLLAFSYVLDLDASVVNVVTVLGLGLCIDYSLLVVSRYREEIGVDHAKDDIPDLAARADAMATTMATAGRTIVFSAVTVAISVSALVVFDVTIIRAVGLAALSVVLVALLVAITLVPALLSLMTRWVSRRGLLSRLPVVGSIAHTFGDAPPAEGFFSRLAARVQRHPWLVAIAVTAVLVVLALPSLRMVLVSSGIELLPEDAEQRLTVETIADDFPAGATPQVRVVAGAVTPELEALAEEVAQIEGVEQVNPAREQGDVVVLDVFTDGDGQGTQAQQVVVDIRDRAGDLEVWVTGRAASLVDFVDTIAAQAPLALGLLAVATFVLLFLLTGSVLIPVKALVMIVLSLGASFGALVWIFQDGRAESLLDYSSVGGIEAVIPLFVFAFAFGLAMDYEVFLLSRIKEFHDAGLDNDEAVRAGLQRTGRVITSAALIIVVVFAGFVVGDLLVIKQTGVALAIAVVIDATLVRILLVPATMTLLGDWNWWAPGPLRRLHARFGLRESEATATTGVPATFPTGDTAGDAAGGASGATAIVGATMDKDSHSDDGSGSSTARGGSPTPAGRHGAGMDGQAVDLATLLELYGSSAAYEGRRSRRRSDSDEPPPGQPQD